MKKYFILITLFIFSGGSLLAEEKIGKVWNYNADTGLVTVLPPAPGYFNMGEELFIYTEEGKLLGKLHVEKSFHTKVEAVSPDKNSAIDRSSVVVKKPEDFAKAEKKRASVISYKEISNEARGWSVKIQFSGAGCDADSRVQARKLDFANVIGFRVKNENYYQPVKISAIHSLIYQWDGTQLLAKSVKTSEKTYDVEEIIASSPVKKIKAPASCRDEAQEVVIQLKKSGSSGNNLIDIIPLKITVLKPSKLKGAPAYLIKIYSNQKFVIDYVIDFEMMKREEIKSVINLPVYYFSPGVNNLEAVMVDGKLVGNEVYEDKNSLSLGKTVLDFSNFNYNHSLSISGKGKRLKLDAN